MAEDRTVDQEHQISRRRVAEGDTAHAQGGETYQPPQGYSATLLNNPSLGGRGNSGTRAQVLLGAQRAHGNRAVQRYVHRSPYVGTVSVQRDARRAPGDGKSNKSGPGAIWDALMAQLKKMPVQRPGPGEVGGPLRWDSNGNMEYVQPDKRHCRMDPPRGNSSRFGQRICPDPWDEDRNIYTDVDWRNPESFLP